MKKIKENNINNKFRKDDNPFQIKTGQSIKNKMGALSRGGWSEDVFISDSGEREMVGKSFSKRRLPLIGFFLFLFLFVLVGRSAWLQVVNGEYYREVAEGNRVRIERTEPNRGIIYDRNLKLLVRNKANFMLYFLPIDLPPSKHDEEESSPVYLEDILGEISSILEDVSYEDLMESVKSVNKYSLEGYQPLFVADNIEHEKAVQLYLKSANWPGVILSSRSRREYLNNTFFESDEENKNIGVSMSHILGYTGKINREELENYGEEYQPIDYIGKMGIEYFWENELKGRSGKKSIEVDALGKEKKIIGQIEAQDGHSLVLSIDIDAQVKLEEILTSYLEKLDLQKASAVVLNPNNGEIIAMVSLPAYDNNMFARGITSDEYGELLSHDDKPLYNRGVSGEYPSGSTFKSIVAAAALEERIISENTSFLSTGGIRISQWFFPDWRSGGHGITDVRKALSDSVNTFFYYIGGGHDDFSGLGVDKIVEYAKLFGLGSQTGVDLAGETGGFLPSKEWKKEKKGERWYIGDTYHLAIGQGDILVTPLQVALYTSVFANGGKLYRPHFVIEMLTDDDKEAQKINADLIKKDFIDDYNMTVVRQGLRRTVTHGSARRLSGLSVSSAGKTGTAQWSSKKEPHAWYAGFAPFNDPEIAFSILVEEGKEGSGVTVSVAKEFMEWYFRDK